MAYVVGTGANAFESMRAGNDFLVDKTSFIRDWWRSADDVTLICRPRRFGKTLTLSMVECFFATTYAGRGDELFGGLGVWDGSDLCDLQGSFPTVHVSFADAKGGSFEGLREAVCDELARVWRSHAKEIDATILGAYERGLLCGTITRVEHDKAPASIKRLCELLLQATGRDVIVLIDEYDTPLQEAWACGCWDRMGDFMCRLLTATLKTNPSLERALVTGITYVAPGSAFAVPDNLEVVTTTSDAYATSFGFTEDEVYAAMDAFGLDEREEVRRWYDGFSFGSERHLYNPWSVMNYLDKRVLGPYGANTSSNGLVSSVIRCGAEDLLADFEVLLAGGCIHKAVDEQVELLGLRESDDAVWSLLLASGYVRADNVRYEDGIMRCDLTLTNHEVVVTFDGMVRRWFQVARRPYSEFLDALLAGDARAMTRFLSDVAAKTNSCFDSGIHPSEEAAQMRFWHGIVASLVVELRETHQVLSNRESGYGRYDTMIVPRDTSLPATVIAFKVMDAYDGERTLEDAVASALAQIAERDYDAELVDRGFAPEQIRHFGVAFQGKRVLVG